MGGPIVRTGPSPEFSKNWDSVFGKKKKSAGSAVAKPVGSAAPKSAKKPAKRKAKSG